MCAQSQFRSKPEQISGLVKKWLESGEDSLPDEIKNALQYRVHPTVLQRFTRRIIERYKEGSVSLHFHIADLGHDSSAEFGIAQTDITQYCAVAYFSGENTHHKRSGRPHNLGVCCHGGCETQRTVLIEVMEFAEYSQWIIPSSVWLQSLDQCRSLLGDPLKPFSFRGRQKTIVASTDRESCLSYGRLIRRVRQDKLPNEMIESRSDVEEEISNYGSEFWRGFGQSNAQHSQVEIRIILRGDLAIAMATPSQDSKYGFQMFLCPDQFDSGST